MKKHQNCAAGISLFRHAGEGQTRWRSVNLRYRVVQRESGWARDKSILGRRGANTCGAVLRIVDAIRGDSFFQFTTLLLFTRNLISLANRFALQKGNIADFLGLTLQIPNNITRFWDTLT
jgi:hypothetical protein